jgi:hypothetical protein
MVLNSHVIAYHSVPGTRWMMPPRATDKLRAPPHPTLPVSQISEQLQQLVSVGLQHGSNEAFPVGVAVKNQPAGRLPLWNAEAGEIDLQ